LLSAADGFPVGTISSAPRTVILRGAERSQMGNETYVGNLSYLVDDQALNQYFSEAANALPKS
jgi:hypothetical protein